MRKQGKTSKCTKMTIFEITFTTIPKLFHTLQYQIAISVQNVFTFFG